MVVKGQYKNEENEEFSCVLIGGVITLILILIIKKKLKFLDKFLLVIFGLIFAVLFNVVINFIYEINKKEELKSWYETNGEKYHLDNKTLFKEYGNEILTGVKNKTNYYSSKGIKTIKEKFTVNNMKRLFKCIGIKGKKLGKGILNIGYVGTNFISKGTKKLLDTLNKIFMPKNKSEYVVERKQKHKKK